MKKRKPIPKGATYAQVLAAEKAKKDAERQLEMKLNANIYVERALWLSVVSIADAYGFGPKRLEPYFEKLREKAQKVTGAELTYVYEKELKELQDG